MTLFFFLFFFAFFRGMGFFPGDVAGVRLVLRLWVFFINYITVIMSFFKECFSAITTQGSFKKRMRNEASFA